MYHSGNASIQGALNLQPLRKTPISIADIIKRGLPSKNVNPFVNEWRRANLIKLLKSARKVWIADKLQIPFVYGSLYLTIVKPVSDNSELLKRYIDSQPNFMNFTEWASLQGATFRYMPLGLAGMRVVTDAGVAFIVDAFQNTKELENLKYHALGTGSTAEAAGDTALVTELTTEYTGNVRATGTTTEGATANVYRTVGTNTLDGTPGAALREHGTLDQAAPGGGSLLDRTVYAAITLTSGDGLQSTYDLTFNSGS